MKNTFEARQIEIGYHPDGYRIDKTASPGIGCPVIASLAGASMALLVAEPTVSGIHDMQRVADLCAQLDAPAVIAANKSDVNPEMTASIQEYVSQRSLRSWGACRTTRK